MSAFIHYVFSDERVEIMMEDKIFSDATLNGCLMLQVH